ncbi:MAG: DNA topoisomerase 4 subunit A [Alphaproteobacteria bacterium]|nr:DNA topoisomerase 4 subunit A [Alphaproteobacteria bacterium]
MMEVQPVSLEDAARERYLSYALSVITSRALPDVRDGLKPVQRRILYTMFADLGLVPDGRYRKSANVVGDVMARYHPHGDSSIYEALVRMAQDFSLRNPLVDPQGNFGSLDGDPPAAYRYTECKLAPIAIELLQELRKDTVPMRPTYDGQRDEPIVLPAQFPQLLVNGCEGIAVGMSTRIPPHNLGESIDACVALIDGTARSVSDLLEHIHGPDFPTGGRLLNDRASLEEIYTEGQGSLRVQGEWTTERDGRRQLVILTSVPYGQNKAKLVERIGADVATRKLPLVVDVRDESDTNVRVVLELKQGASPEAVMAYLYKRTPLESTWPVNVTVLVPSEREDIAVPERLDLKTLLEQWLLFRYDTVYKRYQYDLRRLEERIHLLEGFAIIFADLDEVIRIIRESEGKKDAARKLMERFPLDELQTDAILELRLYRLARLEIQIILDELEEKRAAAAEIRSMLDGEDGARLGQPSRLWLRVRSELVELRKLYADPRRTTIGEPAEDLAFDETEYIVREDTYVVVSRDGWIKRQSSFSSVDKIRVRDADEIGWLLRTNTSTTTTFFCSDGGAYTLRTGDIPATTGHGKPLQTFFTMDDGVKVVGVIAHDPVCWAELPAAPPPDPDAPPSDDPAPPHVVSVTREGRIQRFALDNHAEPSNKNGRMYARFDKGDAVVAAWPSMGGEWVCLASREGNVLVFPVGEANLLKAAGKGVTAIKLKGGDEVLAFELARTTADGPTVATTNGREFTINQRKFEGGSRAARGRAVIKRGGLDTWVRPPQVVVGKGGPTSGVEGGEE